MVKDHSHSERGNPLPPHGLLFLISSYYVVGFEVTLFCWLGSLFVFVDAIVDHLLVDCSEVLPPRYNIQKSQYRVAVCRCFGMMYVIKYLPDWRMVSSFKKHYHSTRSIVIRIAFAYHWQIMAIPFLVKYELVFITSVWRPNWPYWCSVWYTGTGNRRKEGRKCFI